MPFSVWGQFLAFVEEDFNKNQQVLLFFLKQLQLIDESPDKITLGCANPGLKNFVENKLGVVDEKLSLFAKKKLSVELVVTGTRKKIKEAPLLSFEPTAEDILVRSGFSRRFRFDNFAVSSSNQVAYAAAQAVVKDIGVAYNPLFLYGGVGVGKTHLAQSVGRQVLEADNKKRVCFSPGDLFTNELIESIRSKTTPKFRRKYRQLDLLVIDDVQFIAGKQTVQEEFFHTFNSIISFGGQIILTSDQPPDSIKNLEDRLRSRFSGGLTIDIQSPDFELRTAILLIKAREKNIDIDIEAAKIIAEKTTDARSLEGTLLSLYAKIIGQKESIDKETALLFLSDKTEKKIKKITPNDVLRTVCSYYNVKLSHLKGDNKENQIVLPRQVAMFILRKNLKLRLTQVAFFLNKKDHTTVLHATHKITRLTAKDPVLKKEVEDIIMTLGIST